tara:strand:+ start:1854 stop:1964 length:111 start_codon:yes stop_codon:yes gene_type:complete
MDSYIFKNAVNDGVFLFYELIEMQLGWTVLFSFNAL